MKPVSFFLLLLLFNSCDNSKKPNHETKSDQETPKKTSYNVPFFNEDGRRPKTIEFVSRRSKVIVMTTALDCYSSDFSRINERINLYGKVVEIDSITKSRYSYQKGKTGKDLNHFVKIQYDNQSAWVYGKNLYELLEYSDTSISTNGNTFRLIPTQYVQEKPIFSGKPEVTQDQNCINPLVLFHNNQYSLIKAEDKEIFPEGYMTLPEKYDLSKPDHFKNNNGIIRFFLYKGEDVGDCGCWINFNVDIDLKKEDCRAIVKNKRNICI